jgi:hypothetical protein
VIAALIWIPMVNDVDVDVDVDEGVLGSGLIPLSSSFPFSSLYHIHHILYLFGLWLTGLGMASLVVNLLI